MSKGLRIQLREVTIHNWEAVAALEVLDEQEDYLASNVYSLAESKFDPYAVPRAIYAGKKLVGFVMYRSMEDEDEPHEYSIYRLMIDRRHQSKGYGRAALQATLDAIRKGDRKLRRITICYMPDNERSKQFYASFGFREIGLDEDGEMIAELLYP